jgi:glycosyltransferase involved in cell wall biosynthesis
VTSQKTLIISPYFDGPGGVERYINLLANGLAASRGDVRILTSAQNPQDVGTHIISPRVSVTRAVEFAPSWFYPRRAGLAPGVHSPELLDVFGAKTRDVLDEFPADVLHGQNWHSGLEFAAAARQAAGPRATLVNTVHNVYVRDGVARFIPHGGNADIYVSNAILQQCLGTGADTNLPHAVVPLGIDPATHNTYGPVSTRPELNTSRPIILMPTRMDRVKGHEVVLEAALQLLASPIGQKLRPLIVFTDPADLPNFETNRVAPYRQEVKAGIRARGLENDVIVLDTTKDEIPSLIRRSVFVIHPSLYDEGGPFALLEAMACGKAGIGTAAGGQTNLVMNEQNGLLVPKGSAPALAGAMIRLLEHEDLRVRLEAAGLETAKNYTVDTMVQPTLQVYAEATEHALASAVQEFGETAQRDLPSV